MVELSIFDFDLKNIQTLNNKNNSGSTPNVNIFVTIYTIFDMENTNLQFICHKNVIYNIYIFVFFSTHFSKRQVSHIIINPIGWKKNIIFSSNLLNPTNTTCDTSNTLLYHHIFQLHTSLIPFNNVLFEHFTKHEIFFFSTSSNFVSKL